MKTEATVAASVGKKAGHTPSRPALILDVGQARQAPLEHALPQRAQRTQRARARKQAHFPARGTLGNRAAAYGCEGLPADAIIIGMGLMPMHCPG